MSKIILLIFVLVMCSIVGQSLAADDWWEYGHFYQIYPRSFQDSDGDGIGDLNGITSRLPYLKTIGVTGVWLSPIFESPMKDFGYDVSDFRKIQPEYGTMEDFEHLILQCKELDIKLILDFVPNHTSDEHDWFRKSSNPNDPEHDKYKDYFIWNKGKQFKNGTRAPPSNWLSIFRGSAWTWAESRQAYYLNQFLSEQPDVNFRNPAVVEEMNEILRFWLRKGVNGFRVDAVPYLVEADVNSVGLFDDEPLSGYTSDCEEHAYLNHTLTVNQEENYSLILKWRQIVDEPEFSNETRILMTEAYAELEAMVRYYGRTENGHIVEYGAQIPFNFHLMFTNITTNASQFVEYITDFMESLPKGNQIQANWVLGNHDRKRIASRYNPTRTDIFNILLKTLPGIANTYYGEEIGMTDQYISWADTVDPQACRTNEQDYYEHTRDPARTPMQWDNSTSAGFSNSSKTWLPVADNYTISNVQLQESQTVSHLNVFKSLISLRQNPTMKYGDLKIKVINDDVIVYKRQIEKRNNVSKSIHESDNSDIIVVVLNLGTQEQSVKLDSVFEDLLPQKMEVIVASVQSSSLVGKEVNTQNVVVPPEVGIVLTGKYSHTNGSKQNSALFTIICCLLFVHVFISD